MLQLFYLHSKGLGGHAWSVGTFHLKFSATLSFLPSILWSKLPKPLITLRKRAVRKKELQKRAGGGKNEAWGRRAGTGSRWDEETGRQRPEERGRTWCAKSGDRRLGLAISWCWDCNERPEEQRLDLSAWRDLGVGEISPSEEAAEGWRPACSRGSIEIIDVSEIPSTGFFVVSFFSEGILSKASSKTWHFEF